LSASPWNPHFSELDPRHASIAAAARAFAGDSDWPPVAEWNARLAAAGLTSPVEFVAQRAPIRRRGVTRAPYDAEVSRRGRVPSRERCWHDFLNMLVWASFPLTKKAIHERQLDAAESREPASSTRLNRGRERDALSMLDEGGVLLAIAPDRSTHRMLIGHALHEHLVLRRERPLFAAALPVPTPDPHDRRALDLAASRCVADTTQLLSPRAMARIHLTPASARPAPDTTPS
jgi:hypothetical protein